MSSITRVAGCASAILSPIVSPILLCSFAVAAGPPAGPLRLDDVLAMAREANPEIHVARGRAKAAEYGPAQARAWDDPVLSWEAWNMPENFNIADAENSIFKVAQRIPFPGKRKLAAAAAGEEARAMARGVDTAVLDVDLAVKRAYWTLWRAHRRLGVYEQERAIAERVARTAEGRYAAGGVPQADVLRAQVGLTHAVTDAKTGELTVELAESDLNVLLDRSPRAPLGTPVDPAPRMVPSDDAALVATALRERPEVAVQEATIAREQRTAELARKALLPDVELSVSRFINAGASDGFGAMAAVTLPIANKGKYDAAISQANARIVSAEADRRRIENVVRRDVEQAWLRLRTAALAHNLQATTHLPHAEITLQVTESGYTTGRVDLMALLDTVRELQMVHLEHVDSAAEIEVAWAELERAVGGPLPAAEVVHD